MVDGVGIAGCGRMGVPMLKALMAAGIETHGYDVRPSSDYGDFAVNVANDATEFARTLKVLISVVRDIDQTDDVLFGAQNFTKIAPDLKTVVVCSTLSPKYIKGLRERVPDHIEVMDAPMSGGIIGAEEARLSFMLGGQDDTINRMMPLFQAMGKTQHLMGGLGDGMQAKVLNNLLAASHTSMMRLVMTWADQAGLDQGRMLDLINASSGINWVSLGFDELEFARDGYAPNNSIAILEKDILSALDAVPDGGDTRLPEAVLVQVRNLKALSS